MLPGHSDTVGVRPPPPAQISLHHTRQQHMQVAGVSSHRTCALHPWVHLSPAAAPRKRPTALRCEARPQPPAGTQPVLLPCRWQCWPRCCPWHPRRPRCCCAGAAALRLHTFSSSHNRGGTLPGKHHRQPECVRCRPAQQGSTVEGRGDTAEATAVRYGCRQRKRSCVLDWWTVDAGSGGSSGAP